MSSVADDRDQHNDDLNDDLEEIDSRPTSAAVGGVEPGPTRPSPVATDFSHLTTRFMLEGRVWTRANRERALDALRRAVVAWSGIFWLTYWKWIDHLPFTGTAEQPGHGIEHQTTIELYGKWLANGSRGTYPKGQAVCTTMARCRYGGHSDDECVLRSGLLMDSDDCGGWDEARALCRDVGLAFDGQMRPITPDRHHLEVPLAPVLVPDRDDSGVVNWKRVYRAKLGWTLGIFSELVGLRYEPFWEDERNASAAHAGYDPCCDQLTHLNYVYTRRPEDPKDHFPVTDWANGGALDFNALIALTDFDAAQAQLESPVRRAHATTSKPFVARKNVLGLEEIDPPRISNIELLVRLRRLRNADSQALMNLLLEGQSYAPLRQRDTTMHRAASIIAALAPNEDPVQLAKLVFTKSLTTMQKLPGADPVDTYVETYLALAAKKISRAQQRLGGGAR